LNPVKIKVLHEQLELLLEKLIVMVKCVEYKEELFEEVIQFEVSIIQANHVMGSWHGTLMLSIYGLIFRFR
jgi:hypothetical protein